MNDSNLKENTKRIAKNTLLLYLRMLVTMSISLYTSRVVLNVLGINDYGVYNVVGGVVAMFALLTNSLSAAISRFFAFALGKQDEAKLKSVFSTSVSIQLTMSIVIIILAEVLGFFFLNRLNIPVERFDAARWVFHFAVLSFAINLISVPYNAAIIAHEKMSAFAYISILEAFLKLLIVFLLSISIYDKLITYAALFAVVAVFICLVYVAYCRINFKECHYSFSFDKSMLKEMSNFAGWNLLGSGAVLFNTQGVNIITNIFFGVGTNAARGIALQVEHATRLLAQNFTTAINPQITKSYASGNIDYMHSLVCRGAKFSYLLMLILVMPFMFEAESILKIWLKNYPPEAPLFLRLSLIGSLFDILGNSTANAAWATGNIKRYYIIVSSAVGLVFPFSLICFYLGCPAYMSYIVFAIIYCIVVFLKVYIIRDLIKFSPKKFNSEVLVRIVITTLISSIIPFVLYTFMTESILRTCIITAVSMISVCLSIFFFGLTKSERSSVVSIARKKLCPLYQNKL